MLAFSGCKEVIEEPAPQSFEITVRQSEVSYNNAVINVRHNGPEEITWYGYLTEDVTENDYKLYNNMLKEFQKDTGKKGLKRETNRNILLENLKENWDYKYLVFAIDENGKLISGANIGSVKFKTAQNMKSFLLANSDRQYDAHWYKEGELNSVAKVVQVGVRDVDRAEVEAIRASEKVDIFFAEALAARRFEGASWGELCRDVVEKLPQRVYVSLDIDALKIEFCSNTNMPTPGGMTFDEVVYLVNCVVESGREIVGFDISEVVTSLNERMDAIVAARLLAKLSVAMLRNR